MNKSGIILIVVGAILLANNFGLLGWSWLKQWWPALLIVLGVWSLISHRPGDKRTGEIDKSP